MRFSFDSSKPYRLIRKNAWKGKGHHSIPEGALFSRHSSRGEGRCRDDLGPCRPAAPALRSDGLKPLSPVFFPDRCVDFFQEILLLLPQVPGKVDGVFLRVEDAQIFLPKQGELLPVVLSDLLQGRGVVHPLSVPENGEEEIDRRKFSPFLRKVWTGGRGRGDYFRR